MILQARAVVIRGEDIDTDVLYPGAYLNVTDVTQMSHYLFEGLDPSLRDELGGDTALVVGSNFGAGSSREHVPQAMSASGIRFLVGKSFARIFHRNCINLGLPAIACPEAAASAWPGASAQIEPETGAIVLDGHTHMARPLPPFMLELLQAGGLVPWIVEQRGRAAAREKA